MYRYDDSCLKRVSVPLTVGGPAETCDCYVKGILSGGFTITSGSRIEVASAPIPGVFTAVPRDPDSTYFAIPLASVVLNTDQYFRVDMGGYDAVFTAINNININSGLLLVCRRLTDLGLLSIHGVSRWTCSRKPIPRARLRTRLSRHGPVRCHEDRCSWGFNSSLCTLRTISCTPTGNSTNGYAATLVSSKDAGYQYR